MILYHRKIKIMNTTTNVRKTSRKNKTKQTICWPSSDGYFTIDTLIEQNPHMITSSGSDITLRVRLNKAITEENLVSVIGQKNSGKGRPQLVFSMNPINQSVLEKAKSDGISMNSPKIIPVINISNQTPPSTVKVQSPDGLIRNTVPQLVKS